MTKRKFSLLAGKEEKMKDYDQDRRREIQIKKRSEILIEEENYKRI